MRSAFFAILLVTVSGGPFSSTALAQVFENRTYESGLDGVWQGQGVATADYDGDGDQDVYMVSKLSHDPFNPRSWNRFYSNNGDGTFTEVTDEAGVRVDFLPLLPRKLFGNKWGASWADYDRDGDPDLFLTNVGPEVLFRNNGDGTFTDVADDAGLNIPDSDTDEDETSGGMWWDFNLDGYLDLYVSSWIGKNRFYVNNGDGTFTNIAPDTGLDLEDRTLLSVSWDQDRDGWPDLYLVNDFGENRFLRNLGNGQFEDQSHLWGLDDAGESMGVAVGDVNGDLLPEIFVTNNATRLDRRLNTFFVGGLTPPLLESAVDLGLQNADWAWGTEFADGDLDGDMDLFIVNGFLLEGNTPNRYYKNMLVEEGSMRWVEDSETVGLNGMAESRGLLLFDGNQDGALDVLISNWGQPPYYYESTASSNEWLKVSLNGVTSNPHGFGAEIRLYSELGIQSRFYNGADYLGQSVQPAHFGLDSNGTYDAIEVIWPNGIRERWEGGNASRLVLLTEGTGQLIPTHTEEHPDKPVLADVFPVPAAHSVTFKSTNGAKWSVWDILGRPVPYQNASGVTSGKLSVTLDVSSWTPGLYILLLVDENTGTNTAKKIIVVR